MFKVLLPFLVVLPLVAGFGTVHDKPVNYTLFATEIFDKYEQKYVTVLPQNHAEYKQLTTSHDVALAGKWWCHALCTTAFVACAAACVPTPPPLDVACEAACEATNTLCNGRC
jgi:hypothetical protein